MQAHYAHADRCIDALAERIAFWRPGQYAAGLYAHFADALQATQALDAAQTAYCNERLWHLAQRVGIALPHVVDIAGSSAWQCHGVIHTPIDPYHLGKVLDLLFPQTTIQVRVIQGTAAVELWGAMPRGAGQRWIRHVEAVLKRPPIRRVVGNCLVLPTPASARQGGLRSE